MSSEILKRFRFFGLIHICHHSLQDGQWIILEPIMYVEIVAPEENQGTIMTMMSRRDGVILGTDGAEGWVTLEVEAPLNKVCITFPLNLRTGVSV